MVKRGDWVKCTNKSARTVIGFVTRVAKNGAWADVKWRSGSTEWVKRMATELLIPQHTITIDGIEITDCVRKQELRDLNMADG